MAHHEPLKALGPVDWSDIPQDNLQTFLNETFSHAQAIIDSIPAAPAAPAGYLDPGTIQRPRAKTESAVNAPDHALPAPLRHDATALRNIEQLRKEWKEVKVNARENPHGMVVYKMSSKDGRGAWFARQSTHEGLSFEKWKAGLESEFQESMKVQGSPGSGNIRGIGADKRVEDREVEGAGHLEVFQLSAQFPGPTAPRDFITLFLTSDFSHAQPATSRAPREFMIVSKPCVHPECPPRDGIIRGQYESVEIIREVPCDAPGAPRRSMTSSDLAVDLNHAQPHQHTDGDRPMKIQWLMVTRSDPGGSVPRFMIERGTPPGIVGDAGKFLKWVDSRGHHPSGPDNQGDHGATGPSAAPTNQSSQSVHSAPGQATPANNVQHDHTRIVLPEAEINDLPPTNSSGLYGMITGALGLASSVVADGIRRQFIGLESDSSDTSSDTAPAQDHDNCSVRSDASSQNSFASALERYLTDENDLELNKVDGSIQSGETKFASNEPHEKELRRLHERRRKLDEKVAQMHERMHQRRAGESEKDAAQLAKARDKHEKEIAKQEAKYRRELQKLEEKRAQELRKAMERKRKQEEREKKNNLVVELEKTRTERDIARKQIEILEQQVGELQAQNTMLVAKMGKLMGGSTVTLGTGRERSDSSSTKSLATKNSDKSAPLAS
ncbi:hypothetical protein NLU13_3015 [Sarocladium strictum]|uniref:DUF3074 domain-containing protein n=1 Tax=Sarocladium strictum TaxID=5046 RepID=A0AA39GL76_SARSR|nr:hypothetical protein NLU13_3015 [Sarocladium strictum]